jgi:hydrogenase-4 component B
VVTPGGGGTIVGGPLQLQMTSLAGVFVALLGVVAVGTALYAPRYHEPGHGSALYLAIYNLALLACLAVLAACCVALGVGAPLILIALSRAVRTVTGVGLRPVLLPGNLTVIPAHTDFSAFSPTYLAAFMLAVLVVPLLIYLAGRPRAGSVTVPVWDGGILEFKPRMQYSAMTFSAPTRVMFDALYRPSVSVRRASDDPAGRSGPVHYESQVTPVFERYLYRPVVRAAEWLADVVRPLQSGDVNLYLFYVFAMLLVAYLLGAI